MNFLFIDRIVHLEPGVALRASKAISYGEEYFVDHFAGFPILPGAMMLEAMVQAARWLEWSDRDFEPVGLALAGVRGVRFLRYAVPGQVLEVSVRREEGTELGFRGEGRVEGERVVTGRFDLVRREDPCREGDLDRSDRLRLRRRFQRLLATSQGRGAEAA